MSNEVSEAKKRHYEIEKELASRLRVANKDERRKLYSSLYDELFQRVPDHPQKVRKQDPNATRLNVAAQMLFLGKVLRPGVTFLEIGPGDCSLSFEVCKTASKVYAIDVSNEIAKSGSAPDNFQLIISDGSSIDLPEGSVDVAYSNQLMEHLHPEDASDQLKNVYKALKSDGVYVCLTPNRIAGPHDVSRYFDDVATGFHLKEYTIQELISLMKSVGFRRFSGVLLVPKAGFVIPLWIQIGIEKILASLPKNLWRKAKSVGAIRFITRVQIIAYK